MKTIFIVLVALIMTSCLSNVMDDDYTHIDTELKPYVDSFVSEATKRGVYINTDDLKISFGDLKGEAEGRTYYSSHSIIIDSTSNAWRSGMREQLVYHELGHLLLKRSHDNAYFESKPFDICKSIMSAEDSPYYEKKYSLRREYYINELFNPNESKPTWLN